jgi:hypothetical protein
MTSWATIEEQKLGRSAKKSALQDSRLRLLKFIYNGGYWVIKTMPQK